MAQQWASYIKQVEAELRSHGVKRIQTTSVLEEVWAERDRAPGADPTELFGAAEQFTCDVLEGRRPLRVRYLRQLRLALSYRGVPVSRAEQVLAEVDAHVTGSGTAPVTAFGPPDRYATQVAEAVGAPGRPPWPPVIHRLGADVSSVAGTVLTVEGIVAFIHHHLARFTLGLLLVAVAVALLNEGWRSLVRRPTVFGCSGIFVAFGGLFAQSTVLVWFQQPVLGSLSAWAFIVIGLALIAASIRLSRPSGRQVTPEAATDPRPGGFPDPRRTKWREVVITITADIAVLTARRPTPAVARKQHGLSRGSG
ncbi:hypothetical protein KZZ52_00465 [Dactylosporangium sp. AC04546]|uniref:hypothetical protein n=1 Tax=Dactylosporangium sp. AC04546 TaxID=2862460 RepID=UPI001EDCDE73|nr:hypothetical protein [Dactylosporangium sp. AC04546]WVK83962.1 hypothetical protein KZZ52_00465 [Dactylosporangium sp. AC04546]